MILLNSDWWTETEMLEWWKADNRTQPVGHDLENSSNFLHISQIHWHPHGCDLASGKDSGADISYQKHIMRVVML